MAKGTEVPINGGNNAVYEPHTGECSMLERTHLDLSVM